jgi:hypothetical protein
MVSGAIDVRLLAGHRFPFASVREASVFTADHRRETVKVPVQNG